MSCAAAAAAAAASWAAAAPPPARQQGYRIGPKTPSSPSFCSCPPPASTGRRGTFRARMGARWREARELKPHTCPHTRFPSRIRAHLVLWNQGDGVSPLIPHLNDRQVRKGREGTRAGKVLTKPDYTGEGRRKEEDRWYIADPTRRAACAESDPDIRTAVLERQRL
eukprot:357242-Chlamydomonas_euryale.AAC.5